MTDSMGLTKGAQPVQRHTPAWRVRSKVYGTALVAGLVIGLYALIVAKHGGGDFASLYLADARLVHDSPIYWMAPEFDPPRKECPDGAKGFELPLLKSVGSDELVKLPPCLHPNLNPPFLILITAPLAYLGFDAAWNALFMMSLVCTLAVVRIIQREQLIPAGAASFAWVSVGYLLYLPTLISFFLGQVTFIVMLPMVLGWVALRNQRDAAAGAWLGLAASLKPFVALIWLGLAVQKNARAAGAMILAGLVCAVIGLLPGGLSAYLDYSKTLHTIDWQAASWNASLAGFFSRPLGGSQNIPWIDAPEWARGFTTVATLAILAVYVWALRQSKALTVLSRSDWLLALSLPVMLLASPLGWLYYFPFLLITVLVVWHASSALPNSGQFRWALAVTLILSSIPSWLVPAKQMNDPLDWFGATGFYTVALLQLLGLTVLAMRPASRDLQQSPEHE